MIEVKVDVKDLMTGELKAIRQQLKKVPQEATQEFKALTPIRSGNARRRTYLQGDTIRAAYPYAEKLDEGYSKQAPRGMTTPWELWLEKKLKSILGK
jgi:hypothetical protein